MVFLYGMVWKWWNDRLFWESTWYDMIWHKRASGPCTLIGLGRDGCIHLSERIKRLIHYTYKSCFQQARFLAIPSHSVPPHGTFAEWLRTLLYHGFSFHLGVFNFSLLFSGSVSQQVERAQYGTVSSTPNLQISSKNLRYQNCSSSWTLTDWQKRSFPHWKEWLFFTCVSCSTNWCYNNF